jgi:hypothetical protein
MKNVKTNGAQPLTLHVVSEVVNTKLVPVKKLKPKKQQPGEKVKVVYKDSMERMTNRDWTGVKKRLRFLLLELQNSYDRYQEAFLSEMMQALEKVLSYEGKPGCISRLTQEDFRPSNWYRFHAGPDAIYEPYALFPTKNFDKHPDALDELQRAKQSYNNYWANHPLGLKPNEAQQK